MVLQVSEGDILRWAAARDALDEASWRVHRYMNGQTKLVLFQRMPAGPAVPAGGWRAWLWCDLGNIDQVQPAEARLHFENVYNTVLALAAEDL